MAGIPSSGSSSSSKSSSGGSGGAGAPQIDYTEKFDELIEAQIFSSDKNFIKYVAAKLFANVSFELDHRPVSIIANECVSKAKSLLGVCKRL